MNVPDYTIAGARRGENMVEHPPHYTANEIECIEAIAASMTPEAYRGHLKGNCIKYLWRYEQKGGVESLEKCQWYLTRLIYSVKEAG